MKIYIEIPNCFNDYLSKFGILKVFSIDNIPLSKIPDLDLPQVTIDIFSLMLDYDTNAKEKIEKFIKEKIGIEKYSFHQVQIFIKLFISQYSKFNCKLEFYNGGKKVTDDCIQEFANCTKYFTAGGFAKLLNEKKNYENDDVYIDLLTSTYDNDLKGTKFEFPLIFIIKEKKKYIPLKIPNKNSKSNEYLKDIKRALNLENDVENDKGKLKSLKSILNYETDDYVITNDNFKKMILLVYRIKANIPVIIMGETGCGKTALITKLNQLLNNGEKTVKIIDIHPGTTDEYLYKEMKAINKKASEFLAKENQKKSDKNSDDEKEIWVFFDEINTCQSFSLLTEIFINRTFNGEKLSDNIRLIGACNPYRRRKYATEKCGLSRDDDKENDLVYLVRPLP